VPGRAPGIEGGRYNVIDKWFGFIAQYDPPRRVEPDDGWRRGLQTVSAPTLPHVNRGALFGMGASQDGREDSEKQAEGANTLFAVVSLIAACGISVWVVLRGRQADAWICAALGLILGGTVGNLYDRVVFHGVRDFLFFYKIDFPVFNVADSCLVCGAIMLVLHAVFVKTPKPQPEAQAAAAVPAPTTAG
jgi:lipoprotein signal peptidase